MRKLAPFLLVVLIATYAWAVCSTQSFTVIDFHGQSAGTLISGANLLAGTDCVGASSYGSISAAVMAYVSSPFPNNSTTPIACGGSFFTDNTALAIAFHGAGAGRTDKFSFVLGAGQGVNVAAGFGFSLSGATMGSGDLCDQMSIQGAGDGLTLQYAHDASTYFFDIERSPPATTVNGKIPFVQNHNYWFTMLYKNGGPHLAAVFDMATKAQICTSINVAADGCSIAITSGLTGTQTQVILGFQGSCSTTAGVTTFGRIKIDKSGTGLINP